MYRFFVLVSACAVKLAPDFSGSSLKNLDEINKQVEFLFTKTVPEDKAASKEGFNKAKEAYDDLIVNLKTLKRKLEARPMPEPPIFSLFTSVVDIDPDEIEKFTETPMIGSIKNLINQAEKIKNTHEKFRLTAV